MKVAICPCWPYLQCRIRIPSLAREWGKRSSVLERGLGKIVILKADLFREMTVFRKPF